MEVSNQKPLEVRISRWQSVVMTILFLVLSGYFYFLAVTTDARGQTGLNLLLPVSILFALVSVVSASLWLRRRPLFTIDDQGLTDCGFFSQGFGLIRWENIEAITPRWLGRGGLNLFLKVNNYKELLAKRNPLMKPLIMFGAAMNSFYDAQIVLPIGWGDTNVEIITEQIHRRSKNKIQVPEPFSTLKSLGSTLALNILFLLLLGAVVGVPLALCYMYQHR